MSRKITQNTRDFRELCKLTERICHDMPESLPAMQGKKRWQQLYCIWKEHNKETGSSEIISDALKYAVNPSAFDDRTDDQKQLLEKITSHLYNAPCACDGLLTPHQWVSLIDTYKRYPWEYEDFYISYYKFLMRDYLSHLNALCIIEISDRDLAIIRDFMEVCKLIFPHSIFWNVSKWLDFPFLLSEFKNHYGLDFHVGGVNPDNELLDDARCFNFLFMLVRCHLAEEPPLEGIYLTNALNMPLARAIWGNDAESVLLNHYHTYVNCLIINDQHNSVFVDFGEEVIRASWLNAHIAEWCQDMTSPYQQSAKKLLFELRMFFPNYLPEELQMLM